nr:putative ribonuclease H-like domain-containing protein [Tanacetum cinerariifolium]
EVPEGSGNPNPTASTSNPLADQMETLTVETPIPTVSLPVPTAYSTDSQEPSTIIASPTPTLRFHKDHPKSQIISPVDTLIQTRNKSKEPQYHCSTEVPEGSGNPNPTASTSNPLADQMETLTVETPIPTVSLPVPTAYSTDSQEPSSDARLISKRVTNQEETPSLDNILSLTNRFEDILRVSSNSDESNGVEADISNMETAIIASPTPTLRFHKDHPKSQIISPVDTLIQTRNKSKEMDVKSSFLYGTIDEEVYVMQPPGFQDPEFPAKVYKVEKAMYGLYQAPRAWYGTLSKYFLKNGFQRGTINQTLFIRNQREYFILVQVYVDDIIFGSSNPQLCREFEALVHEKFQMSAMGDILKKFGYSDVRSSNTPIDKENPWGKEGTGKDVDLHIYRSMIGSLMYLTASRPDIMFDVCACARHQVTPKESHLYAVKRIFRYLKSHPKLGLWYPKESPFDLVAYSDSDYGGATQDRKSTTGGCQFLCRRLISWQCKKQTIVATSTTEAEYVAAASCCGQVLWIQNQLLDYGFNFMNTKIYIHNNSAICIVKNPVYHSKTKHIEIKHHFIRDCFEKKLISVDHIHTDENVADLLTKPFDAGRFQYLVVIIGMVEHAMRGFVKGNIIIYTSFSYTDPTDSEQRNHEFIHVYLAFASVYVWIGIETTDEGTQILATVDGIHRTVIESSLRRNLKLQGEEGISSLPDTELFENLTLMGYNISPNQKFTFQKGFNEFSSNIATALVCLATNRTYNFSKMIFDGLVKNVNNKISKFLKNPRQYTRRARIDQSFALPTVADEPASPYMDVSQEEACPTDSGFIADQDRATIDKSSTLPYDSTPRVTSPVADEGKINKLKERVKMLEDREGVAATSSGDDAPIKGGSINEGEAATERISGDSEEMAIVQTSMDAATVLASGVVDVPTGSGSIPTASTPAEEQVPIGSDVVPAASPVFTTAIVVTPYSRRKGKKVMVESETPKKQRRKDEQIARDAEIARIHVEEELQIMFNGMDRNNETVAKYLQKYHQFASELPIERRIELITDLVKSNLGWKVKDFRGMTFEEVEAKFNSVWKQMEDFIPMGSKEETKRIKRKGLNLEQESAKKQKTSKEVLEEAMSFEEVSEEKVKEMMQLVPIEEVYVKALQVKHPIIDWKAYHEVEWKLYDSCGVHHVTAKDKEIYMLVEKDYHLRKGLALVMICYKLQVENYSQMASDLILKIHKIASSPSLQSD